MERRRIGSQWLRVVRSSRQRNKQYYLSYQQLTEGKIYQISTLLELGILISEIALKTEQRCIVN